MREFKKVNKTFIKSTNRVSLIYNRYLYCLIPFILLILTYNTIWGTKLEAINLLKSISISLITSLITQYIFNLIKKQRKITKLFLEDKILTISIILGLFSINSKIYIIIISSIVSIIIKNILGNTTISSSLYGILIIIISSYFTKDLNTPLNNLKDLSYIGTYSSIVKPYGNILSYTLGLKYYLSPLLSLISFIYLFSKKSIKYNIIFSYIITFILTMLSFGLLNDMNIWYLFFQLTTGNILFLLVFCSIDYPNTPITREGQIIYGIILSLLTIILRFIIPELSVVIPLIIGPILLTKLIDNISFKLKHKKFYYLFFTICIVLVLITNIILNIVF